MRHLFIKRNIRLLIKTYFFFAFISAITPFTPFVSNNYKKEQSSSKACFGEHATSGGDRARVVVDSEQALNIRLELIRSAEKNIDIVYYSIERSECIDALLGELLEAADRGVKVQILVDGKKNLSSKPALKALNTHENISCRQYNPLNLLTPWKWNACLHDKFITVDDNHLLLGGRNLKEEHYAPDGFTGKLTNDLDVLVSKGDVCSSGEQGALPQVSKYMELLWNSKGVKPISTSPMRAKKADAYLKELRNAVCSFEKTNPRFYAGSLQDYLEETFPASSIKLIHNPIHTNKKQATVYNYLNKLMQGAREEVIIQTPYATANKTLLSDFDTVNAKLIMQTNSPLSTPNYPAFSNYYYQRDKFLDTGAKIYEYQGRDSHHGKSLIIDKQTAVIGSFNFDDRSMHINTESMLVIDSPGLANQLSALLEELRQDSLQVALDNTYLPKESISIDEVPFIKIFMLRITYIFLRPFQFLI
jgi:putative cardiolipin synthase